MGEERVQLDDIALNYSLSEVVPELWSMLSVSLKSELMLAGKRPTVAFDCTSCISAESNSIRVAPHTVRYETARTVQ